MGNYCKAPSIIARTLVLVNACPGLVSIIAIGNLFAKWMLANFMN